MNRTVLGIVGAIAGAAVGALCFAWLRNQGFYALMVPGALAGLGAELARTRSPIVPAIAGLMALVVGIGCEWWTAPFSTDASLAYFVTHLHELTPVTLIFIALGVAAGVWFPFSRTRHPKDEARAG